MTKEDIKTLKEILKSILFAGMIFMAYEAISFILINFA